MFDWTHVFREDSLDSLAASSGIAELPPAGCQQHMFVRLVFAIAVVFALGCESKDSQKQATSPLDPADRPPLQVGLIDAGGLIEPIQIAWSTVSDQELELTNYSSEEFVSNLRSETPPQLDAVIFPNRLIGELVESQYVRPVPETLEPLASDWPRHWRQLATYGKRVYGLPLGSPQLVWLTAETSDDAVVESVSNDSESVEPDAEAGPEAANSELSGDDLLPGFLMIYASLVNDPSQLGTLFQVSTADAKLTEPRVLEAVAIWRAAYRKSPDVWGSPPEEVWRKISSGDIAEGFGWPCPEVISNASPMQIRFPDSETVFADWSIPTEVDAPPSTFRMFETGEGLMASIARRTRQSGATVEFIEWLNHDDQRQQFGARDARVQPSPDVWISQNSSSVNRSRYQRLCLEAWQSAPIQFELRALGSLEFRRLLGEALVELTEPEFESEQVMRKYNKSWMETINKLGSSTFRSSLERSLNLGD